MGNGHSLNSGKHRASKQPCLGFSTWALMHSTCAPCAWRVLGHCCLKPPCSRGTHLPHSQTMHQEQHGHIITSGCAQRAAHSAGQPPGLPVCWHPSTQLLQQQGPAHGSCATGEWDGSSGIWGPSRLSVAGDSIRSAAPESPLCNLASPAWLRPSQMVSSGNFLNSDLVGICCWGGHTSP